MRRFGFIFHPLDIGLYANGFSEPEITAKRPMLIEQVMTWFPPFKRSTVTGVKSLTGEEIEGDMILVSLLPEQILTLNSEFVLKKMIAAGKIAEKLGDGIVGLGAYASQVGRKGVLIGRGLNIPVTTGSSYTIAVAVEATLEAAELIGINLSEATLAVIGATGAIGSICSELFASQKPKKMILAARHKDKLREAVNSLKDKYPGINVESEVDIYKTIKDADVIITSTSTPIAIIDVRILKPGTLICDVSRPKNISYEAASLRDDILVIEGGIVRPPGNPDFHFSFGLPPGLAYACIAETMLLTLEGKFESYSIGGNVSLEKANETSSLGRKHGFKLAKLRSFEREVTDEQIEKMRSIRKSGNNLYPSARNK
ncbi:MAG: shikimate dehydrogenase [Candidatus Omnitrophota bacterium]|jgi:predicted amino acid dehydrogenase